MGRDPVPELQCAWQLLLQCAGPRLPSRFEDCVSVIVSQVPAGHDEGMFQTTTALLGIEEQISTARDITTFPMRLGGLGLRSANCTWRLLGIVGRCFANVERPSACSNRGNRGTFEWRTRGMLPRVANGEKASSAGLVGRS